MCTFKFFTIVSSIYFTNTNQTIYVGYAKARLCIVILRRNRKFTIMIWICYSDNYCMYICIICYPILCRIIRCHSFRYSFFDRIVVYSFLRIGNNTKFRRCLCINSIRILFVRATSFWHWSFYIRIVTSSSQNKLETIFWCIFPIVKFLRCL